MVAVTDTRTTRTLKVLEAFTASGVEGPIRLSYSSLVLQSEGLDAEAEAFVLTTRERSKVQTWSVALDSGSVAVTKTADTAYPTLGLNNADRFKEPDGTESNLLHTSVVWDGDYAEVSGYFLPRTAAARIPGGYIVVNGDTGQVTRHYVYPDELDAP